MKRQQIAYIGDLKVREVDGQPSRTIEGYALKFGVRSRLLCDWCELYYEVLEPGSVTREMLDQQDIKLTMFHDRQLILARSNKGKGTLSYEVDEIGVRYWAEMPNTADGDKALELIARGDITGCSFIYSTDESREGGAVTYEAIDENDETVTLRRVHRIDHVYDFTVTPDPAYEQTNVTRREALDGGLEAPADAPAEAPAETQAENPEITPADDAQSTEETEVEQPTAQQQEAQESAPDEPEAEETADDEGGIRENLASLKAAIERIDKFMKRVN